VHPSDAPSLGGPSTVALSLSVTATPDTLPQDGVSTSRIVVKAFNAGGQPYPNLSVRLDMQLNVIPLTSPAGATQDLGTLSARTLLTGADGTATATYTAPAGPGLGGLGSTVAVVATPIASNAANAGILNSVGAVFQAFLHLTPSGTSIPPRTETPTAQFATPAPLTAGLTTLFNGTTSCPSGLSSGACASATSTLTGWDWDFGDGTAHGSGSVTTHVYTIARSYAVTLIVTNSQGSKSNPTVQVIAIGVGAAPTALFTALPNPATVNTAVALDGTSSTSTGQIVNYAWTITSPTAVITRQGGSSPTSSFTPTAIGAWTVSLTITDVNGRSATSANTTVNVQ
jgi:PKD repeat protein